jgi:hypothetical protein
MAACGHDPDGFHPGRFHSNLQPLRRSLDIGHMPSQGGYAGNPQKFQQFI